MAQIILRVKTNTTDAEKGLEALKSNITKLAEQLSGLKINKDLTQQITQLTKYYQSLATAGEKVAKAEAQAQEIINKSATVAKSAASNVETLRKGYANLVNQLKTLETQYPANTFTEAKKSIEDNFKSIQELSKAYQQQSQELLPEQKEKLQLLSDQYKKLAADVAQYRAQSQKIKAADTLTPDMGDTLYRLQSQWASLANTISGISKYYPKGTFDSITQEVTRQSTAVKSLVAEYEANNKMLSGDSVKAIEESQTALLKQKAAFDETRNSATNYHGTLRDLVSGFLKFQLSAVLVMKPLQAMQNAFESINETLVKTETVVVSLQRVLDETVASGEISSELYNIAISLGQTFDNVQEIAQNFAKAGLSWQETLDATKAAVLALNVAELTAEESSEGLIAIMTQFGYEASELTNVIDVLNKAADKSAVDTQELLQALQKTGSYAAAANLSLEDTVSLISALSEATGASGSAMGNALKSLLAYTSKQDSLSTFASLSDEMESIVELYRIGKASILDVWEGLSKEMTSLSAEQANALSQWAENSGLETELGSELSDIYEQLTGVYDTAGTYRKNYFIALLNNFEEVQNVMDEISDAEGYTFEEQAKYMDTYEAKLNSLQSKWEELANDEEGWLAFKKGMLDIASGILDIIKWTGGLKTVVLALGTAITFAFGDKIINSIKTFVSALKSGITAAQGLQAALGWIGLAATAISAIVGGIQTAAEKAKQAAEEARQAALDAWSAVEEKANDLSELYAQYKELANITDKTAEEQKNWASIQENIIDLLGTQAIQLQGLTEGTEEYRQKLEELTKEQLNYYTLVAQAAANAAQEEFENQSFNNTFTYYSGKSSSPYDRWGNKDTLRLDNFYYEKTENADIFEAAKNAGFDISREYVKTYNSERNAPRKVYDSLNLTGNTFEQATQLEEFATWLNQVGYGNTDVFNDVVAALEERKTAIDEYLDSIIKSEYYDYINQNGFIDTSTEFNDVINQIIQVTGATEEWRDEIENAVASLSGYKEIIEDTNDKLDDQITKIEYLTNTALENLIDALNEVKNAEDESLKLEEKKQTIIEKQNDVINKQNDLLKAQKALEDAKNNRANKVLNATTGQFEYQVDQKTIQDAEEDVSDAEEDVANAQESLQDAINSLSEYIKDEAFDAVIDELESGNATNDSILSIINKWKKIAEDSSVANYEWYEKVINTIKEVSGVDITIVTSDNSDEDTDSTDDTNSGGGITVSKGGGGGSKFSYKLYPYDNGGVANGLGYLAKATTEAESVNNPELTAKILSPTSNAEFDRYVQDMGILFDTAKNYSSATPQIVSNLSKTSTSTTDNSITINGVKIGNDMLQKPLIEVLRAVNNLVPSNN